jgi:hypothetical protein
VSAQVPLQDVVPAPQVMAQLPSTQAEAPVAGVAQPVSQAPQ